MPTFTQSVRDTGSTNNDGYEANDTSWVTNQVFLGNSGGPANMGFRFTNVTIPKGSTITSAKLTFRAYSNSSSSQIYSDISGVKEYPFSGFDSSNRPSTGLVITNYSVEWNFTTAWTADSQYDTVDFKDVVQEIIDVADWTSGSAMGIVVIDRASPAGNNRRANDYTDNTSPSFVTNITIEYTNPVSSNPLIFSD